MNTRNGSSPRALVLVANKESGHKKDWLDKALDEIQSAGLHIVERLSLKQLDRLPGWIGKPDPERPMIVVAGGDGTVGSVVEYVAGTPAVLGVLPLGTSNDVARSLNIPVDISKAVHVLRSGSISRIDVGELVADDRHSHFFVHAAAIGLNVTFARMATRASLRERLGRFTYIGAALMALKHRQPFSCELEIDGTIERRQLLHLSIVNAPAFGGFLGLEIPGSSVEDQRLDVLAVTNRPLPQLLLTLLVIAVRRHADGRTLSLFHTRRVRVRPDKPLDVSLDGEICGQVPGDFVIFSRGLHVMAPRAPTAR
ncbi:MAG: diacylglycerol kinase [Chloroflexota bacterium]